MTPPTEKTTLPHDLRSPFAVICRGTWSRRLSLRDPPHTSPVDLASAISAEGNIEFAEPNNGHIPSLSCTEGTADGKASLVSNDPWHFGPLGIREAWSVSRGALSASVAIHDTGIWASHPALAKSLLPGVDFEYDCGHRRSRAGHACKNHMNRVSHGTRCAGVIVAAGRSAALAGVCGVAPDTRIIPVTVTRRMSTQLWATSIERASQLGAVILCPWSITPTGEMRQALQKAESCGRNGLGSVVVAAAGNAGRHSIDFPASSSTVLGVGACTHRLRRASDSNRGAGLDLVAPSKGDGRGLATTDFPGDDGVGTGVFVSGEGRASFGGTSGAAALVAGIVALMLAARPNLPAADLRAILAETATRDGLGTELASDPKTWVKSYGSGLVHAGRAVRAALE